MTIQEGSKLAEILGVQDAFVNSMHHQGILEIGHGLSVAAFGEDGLVEAVEAPNLSFLIGVQWHPEFFASEGSSMAPLLKRLVQEADGIRERSRRCRSCLSIKRLDCGGCFPALHFIDPE